MSSNSESGDEVISIMADSDNDSISFEGFDSEDIREAEKRLNKKLTEMKALNKTNTVTGSVNKGDVNNNDTRRSESPPARPVVENRHDCFPL